MRRSQTDRWLRSRHLNATNVNHADEWHCMQAFLRDYAWSVAAKVPFLSIFTLVVLPIRVLHILLRFCLRFFHFSRWKHNYYTTYFQKCFLCILTRSEHTGRYCSDKFSLKKINFRSTNPRRIESNFLRIRPINCSSHVDCIEKAILPE